MFKRLSVAIALLAAATPAFADDHIPDHHVDRATDGLITTGALGLGLAFSLIPMRDHAPWEHELFGDIDAGVHDDFSRRAAKISDATLVTSILAPAVYLTGSTIEDADGDRLLVYGEAIAIDIALMQMAKRLVQRPRPYTYSTAPDAVRYAKSQGNDAYQSFYSGHSATAFCAATAGAYLASVSSDNTTARTFAWGAGFAVAAATANLRVRAGKHFYSDVVVGGVVGIAIGYAVPALHASGSPYVPTTEDLGAAALGVLGGVVISELLPLEHRPPRDTSVHLAPMVMGKSGGMGFGIAGTL